MAGTATQQRVLRAISLMAIAAIGIAGPAQADMTQAAAAEMSAAERLDTPKLDMLLADDALALPDAIDSDDASDDEVAIYEAVGSGEASFYGAELAGNRTANGERFDPGALTAAHRTLPMGSKLRVTNLGNGKSVIVRINDRGPFVKKRLIDVSRAAAEKISMVRAGKAMVKLELLR